MPHFKPRSILLPTLIALASPVLLAQAQSTQAPSKSATSPPASTGMQSSTPSTSSSAMQTQAMNKSTELSSSDRKFMEKAAHGGVAEVQMGQLAAKQGGSDQVKQFGQRMVDDHSKLNDQLKQIAATKGVSLPTDMDSSEKREHDKLAKLSGASFDREYMKAMVSDHKKDLSEFESKSKSAKDPDLKNFVTNGTSVIQQHYDLAKSTQAALK